MVFARERRRRRSVRRAVVLVLTAVALLLTGACAAGRQPVHGDPGPRARAKVDPARPASSSTLLRTTPTAPPKPRTWTVVALGDSVTTGGPCGCTPFPQRYGQYLTQDRGVPTTISNLGQDGQDSAGLLTQLRDPKSAETAAVQSADIDLLTIGANDFSDQHDNVTTGHCGGGIGTDCIQDDLGSMTRNVAAIISDIHRLRGSRPTAVLVTGYWNVFEDGAVARDSFPDIGVRATQRLTMLANAGIQDAVRSAGATYVDLYAPFNGPQVHGDTTHLLGPDGDHPNAAGQALIARRLVAAGLPGLVQG